MGFVCAHFPDSLFLKDFGEKFAEAGWIYDRERFRKKAEGLFRQSFAMEAATGKALDDRSDRFRKFYISGMRNQPYPQYAGRLLEIVCDPSESVETRVQCAEVLGWFVRAWNRKETISGIDAWLASGEEIPAEVRDELVKTRSRLAYYTR